MLSYQMLDMFCSALGIASLQRHLLAVDASHPGVRTGNDFCQIQMPVERARIPVQRIDEPTEEEPTVAVVASPESHPTLTAALQQLMATWG